MIIAKKYNVPNKCPKDCKLKPDSFYQGSICTRCPIFVCKEPITEEDKMYLPLVPAKEYRSDWAKEWVKFFKKEIDIPKLILF